MSVENPLGIEYRVVSDAEKDGNEVRIVCGARDFEGEIEEVWDAITNPTRLERWFLPVSGNLEPGGNYQFEGNAGGKIITCDKPKLIEVTWEFSGNVSWLTVSLERKDQNTRMTLEHAMGKDPASESHWKQYGPGATGVGWDLTFLGIGLFLVEGDEFDRAGAEAWTATDAGKDFIRECAKSWGEAHIASGVEENLAMSSADNTAKFYCGES